MTRDSVHPTTQFSRARFMKNHPLPILAFAWALAAVPSTAQTKGTPLPGLREKEEKNAPATASPPAPAAPAPPDIPALRKKAETGDAAAQLLVTVLRKRIGVEDSRHSKFVARFEPGFPRGQLGRLCRVKRCCESLTRGRHRHEPGK